MTNQQIKALQSIGKGIIESCNIDSIGAPSGVIYAALMGHGASLNMFYYFLITVNVVIILYLIYAVATVIFELAEEEKKDLKIDTIANFPK